MEWRSLVATTQNTKEAGVTSDTISMDMDDEGTQPLARSATSGGLVGAPRPLTLPDPLYDTIRVSAWAAALLATPPFQRLTGVSLSDVPGELLFGHPFPSRLDHTLGVYHLARLSRPRDRALHAAALAHDLGHGPFSHLTEPLMREWLGEDHEQRSTRLLAQVRAALTPAAAKHLAWLDWDEVAQLLLGEGDDGRGALLNGALDYDNCDNVARFLVSAGFGAPSYDPRLLARSLRPLSPEVIKSGQNGHAPAPSESRVRAEVADRKAAGEWGSSSRPSTDDEKVIRRHRVALEATATEEARGWREDRARVYNYLHEGHDNLALHAMLRKAVDLATASHILPPDFFDLTDAQALDVLSHGLDRGLVALTKLVRAGPLRAHRCVWQAEVLPNAPALPHIMTRWRERLAVEAQLGEQAGLAPYEVIVEVLASNAARALPPIASASRSGPLTWQPEPPKAPRLLHLFVASSAGPDYVRRLRMAAERVLVPLGARYLDDGPSANV